MGKTRGGQRQSPAMAGKQPVRTGSQWEFHLDLLIRDQWFRIFMAPVMAEVEQSPTHEQRISLRRYIT